MGKLGTKNMVISAPGVGEIRENTTMLNPRFSII
jgi:hypothetical protein